MMPHKKRLPLIIKLNNILTILGLTIDRDELLELSEELHDEVQRRKSLFGVGMNMSPMYSRWPDLEEKMYEAVKHLKELHLLANQINEIAGRDREEFGIPVSSDRELKEVGMQHFADIVGLFAGKTE